MHKYEIVIRWSEEDDLYLATAPELGCVCHGATSEAALQALNKLIPFWIESLSEGGRAVPLPDEVEAPPVLSKAVSASQSQREVTVGISKGRSPHRKSGR